jgi:Ca-activated chloride channel homolog
MSFHWPHAFWFLLIPLALLVSGLRRRRVADAIEHPKILRAEASGHALRLSARNTALSTRTKPRVRLCLGLILAVVALARPQWGRLEEPVFDQAREILIAIDLSRSMLAPDVKPSRLDRAKLLITSLLERLQGERVGLVVFAGTAFLQSPLSADYEILREFLPALTPDFLPQGGSNYQALLETSVAAFGESNSADRFLIVLSDGEATDDNWKRTVAELKTKNIRVLGLGIGTAEGAMLPDGSGGFVKDERGAVVLSKLEPRTLQELADTTNGVYVDASGWVDLAQLLQSTVEAGRKGDFRETSRARLAERFQWALAPALVLLLWSFWREFPVRPKVRDVRLQSPSTPPSPGLQETTSGARTATAAALAFMIFLSCMPSDLPAQAAPEATPTAEPLSKLVSQFSTRDTLAARDYAELARTTLTYGERTQAAQQPVPEGPIRDGLAAVDAGRALDPNAADWPKLRADLEKLLEKPEQQKQQDQKNQQDKKDQQEKPQDQKKSEQDKSQDSSKDKDSSDQQKQSEQNESKDSDKKESQEKTPEEKKEEEKSSAADDDKKAEEDKNKPKPQSAFGDMDKPEEQKTPPPPPSPGEIQKVGGAQEKKAPPPTDPALNVPLQKLEQVRDRDSPARLFQLMQDPNAKPEKPPGKNW